MSDQAKAPPTQPFGAEAFQVSETTELRWLGMAGVLVHSRGTLLMIDPVLRDFDMPILIEMAIMADAVPRLDAGDTQRAARVGPGAAAAPVMTRSAAYE